MPGDHALVAQQRVQVPRLAQRVGELLRRRRRPGLRAERRDRLVALDVPPRSSFAHARCRVPNSRSRSSRPSSRRISSRDALSRSDARLSNTCSRPADIRCTSSASVAELDHRHLADPPHAGDLAPGERGQRRVVRLHRDHARARAPTRRARRRARGAGGAR